MKMFIVLAFALFCALTVSGIPTYPHIPDDFVAMIEINHPDCPPPNPHFHFPCPATETFFEARSYTHNALKIAHSREDQFIYHFNEYSAWHSDFERFNCTVGNVTKMALSHHGMFVRGEYNVATNHLVTADQQFHLSNLTFTYLGQSQVRTIYTDDWIASTSETHPEGTMYTTFVWHFSAANWTFGGREHEEHVIPVRLSISGNFTPTTGAVMMIAETQDFVDFRFGDHVPDYRELMVPMEEFCPELIQKPIPVLPLQFSHTFETNDLTRNVTFTGRFFYDYASNIVRMERWMNDANVVTVLDVNIMTNSTFSWHETCTSQPITREGHGFDRLIDFNANPPHLVMLTETFGNRTTEWIYGGLRPVRDVFAETWYVRNNITFHDPFHGVVSMLEIVAWFFTPPGWKVVGLPEDISIPIRASRVGQFFNMTSGRYEFISEHHEFSDVKIGLEPGIFDLPFFCPGGRPLPSSSSAGVSSGGAAGLAFGMLIVGALIGAGALYYFSRRRTTMTVQGSDETVSLHQSSNYGAASTL
jgi:hypothetical protein